MEKLEVKLELHNKCGGGGGGGGGGGDDDDDDDVFSIYQIRPFIVKKSIEHEWWKKLTE